MQQGVVQELHIERTASRGLVGNVYLGRVCRILPGMQSAFIDVGLDRTKLSCTWLISGSRGKRPPKGPSRRFFTMGKAHSCPGRQGPDWHQGCPAFNAGFPSPVECWVHCYRRKNISASRSVSSPKQSAKSCAKKLHGWCRMMNPAALLSGQWLKMPVTRVHYRYRLFAQNLGRYS